MDRERFTRLLEEPGRVAREDLGDLKALTERYPWFSGAQLLRAAGEHAAGNVLFNETLNSATAHLPSRAVLFDLVEQRDHQPLVHTRPEPRILHLPVKEPVAVIPVESPVEREDAPPAETVQDQVTPGSVARDDQADTSEEEEDPLARQIMEAAVASAYDLTWQEDDPPPAPVPIRSKLIEPSASSVVTPVTAARGSSSTQPTPIIEPGSRLRFTDWLASAEPSAGTEPPASTTSTVPPATQDWIRPAPADSADAPISAADTRELIDRFMRQQIPEPTHKAEFFTPQQAAKRSLDDTAGLVTETLARIYEKQGNLPKAVETYRRLALKYPHKSGYFAALQKSLEEQLNK